MSNTAGGVNHNNNPDTGQNTTMESDWAAVLRKHAISSFAASSYIGGLTPAYLARAMIYTPSVPRATQMAIFNSFIAGRHVTFTDAKQCAQISWRRSVLFRRYRKRMAGGELVHHKYLSFVPEYGTKSIWKVMHMFEEEEDSEDNARKRTENDEGNRNHYNGTNIFAECVVLAVCIDRRTRKTTAVPSVIKQLADKHWNELYPSSLKPRYLVLKERLSNHMSLLKAGYASLARTHSCYYSYCLQLRYYDQDLNFHVTQAEYFQMIEESMIHCMPALRTHKQMIHAISVAYWIEIKVAVWKNCFLNVRKINEKQMIDGALVDVYYGYIEMCKHCCKRQKSSTGSTSVDTNNAAHPHHLGSSSAAVPAHEHAFEAHAGFVVQIVSKQKNSQRQITPKL